jgi:hypothetical protein
MATHSKRNLSARIVPAIPTATALALVTLGTWLRIHRLDAIEFKRDEQEVLNLGIRLLADRPWSSSAPWPTHGMLSSNGVPNAPLFTWIIAAAWAPTRDPMAVSGVIALTNALCLYPLWRWARRRMDEGRALLTLAVCAVSPFAVIFSRKIWTQDLLAPGVLTMLWGVEWLRAGRPWLGIALLALAVLLVGQLHQSGAIGIVLLPAAIALQLLSDWRDGLSFRLGRPSVGEAGALATVIGVNLFFWLPYLGYLARLPSPLLANRPTLDAFAPALLLRVGAQIVPLDLFYFFAPHRNDFLRSDVRSACYEASVALGVPLFVYGLWRWLRSPVSVPVFGLWWWCVIAAFTLARIPSHPFYVLALTPLVAVLTAGAFDAPASTGWISRALASWRLVYVVALFTLTVVTVSWLGDRGGAAGDYGVAYSRRKAQGEAIVSRLDAQPPQHFYALGEMRPEQDIAALTCAPVPVEVSWIVGWLDQKHIETPQSLRICDGWIDEAGTLVYRWIVRD